jgi:choline dehydrogenase-like flavoprotein
VDLTFEPSKRDNKLMLEGIKLAARILLTGGAERVMAPTFDFTEVRHTDQIDQFAASVDTSQLSINSAHPQGGNAISPGPETGVVDAELRVHGWENLYVCDASVFPTAVTVNPQLTVMALADYASPTVR